MMSPFQIPLHVQRISKEYTLQDFWAELMQSRQVFGRNKVTFNHRSKRNNRALKWYSEPPLIKCLPIRQDLECFADSSSTPWNPPTIFHPDLIATVQQKSLL